MAERKQNKGFLGTKIGFVTINLVIAIAIGTVLLIALVSWLRKYTDHSIDESDHGRRYGNVRSLQAAG